MVLVSRTFALLAGFVTLCTGAALEPRQTQCAMGAYVISAHGCGEGDAEEGVNLSRFSNGIIAGIAGAVKHILNYRGNCTLEGYRASMEEGARRLHQQINDYVGRCPGEIVLVGYSEGGNVIMNTLGGSDLDGSNPLGEAASQRISAIVIMGDPSRTTGTPGNTGTNNNQVNGLFPRVQASIDNLQRYNGRIISFCDLGDVFCAPNTQGPPGVDVHQSYFTPDHYVNSGVSFAVNLANS